MAIVEKDKVGGTCLHRGCIPAKQFLETASVFRTVAGAKEFGVQADQPGLDFGASQARKQKVVDQLWKGLQGLLKSRKVTTIAGTGSLRAGRTVRVDDGTELKGRHVVLASGSVLRFFGPFPLAWRTGATFVHDWTALALGLAITGHVWLAVADQDALRGMVSGTVPTRWARLKRPRWYSEVSEEAAGK